jgi:PAS domain S-box-containing protein
MTIKVLIALLDVVGLFACVGILAILLRMVIRHGMSSSVHFVLIFLMLSVLFQYVSNSLEWLADDTSLDALEDLLAITLPFFWGLLFLALAQSKHQKELERDESRMRSLFLHTADPLLVFDQDLRVVEANELAGKSLGYRYDELLGMRVDEIEVKVSQEEMKELLSNMEEALTLQGEHKRRNGSTFPVEVRIQDFEFEGSPGFLALARDVTARLDSQHRVEQAGRPVAKP